MSWPVVGSYPSEAPCLAGGLDALLEDLVLDHLVQHLQAADVGLDRGGFLRRVTQAGQVVSFQIGAQKLLAIYGGYHFSGGSAMAAGRGGQQCGREEDGNGVTRTRPKFSLQRGCSCGAMRPRTTKSR